MKNRAQKIIAESKSVVESRYEIKEPTISEFTHQYELDDFWKEDLVKTVKEFKSAFEKHLGTSDPAKIRAVAFDPDEYEEGPNLHNAKEITSIIRDDRNGIHAAVKLPHGVTGICSQWDTSGTPFAYINVKDYAKFKKP